MTQTPFPFAANFVQFGYVTNDIDASIAELAARSGVGQFRRSYGLNLQMQPGVYGRIDVALGWTGATMIELIKPLDGDISLYRAVLPEDAPGMRLHHLGYEVTSKAEWERLAQTLADQNIPITKVDDPNAPMRTIYADFGLGHHSEYLLIDEAARPLWATIPQNYPA